MIRSSAISGTKAPLLAPTALDKARTHEGRGGAVEDDHRRGLEVRARDSRRLVAKIDADVPPPGDVGAGVSREQALASSASLSISASAVNSIPSTDPTCVEHDPGRGLRISRPGQCVRRLRRPPRALAHRTETSCLGLACAWAARQQFAALTPASQEDEGRQERDQARCEREPEVAADRVPAVEHGRAENRSRDPDTREHQTYREVVRRQPGALTPEPRCDATAMAR